jgi:hypothetical protein
MPAREEQHYFKVKKRRASADAIKIFFLAPAREPRLFSTFNNQKFLKTITNQKTYQIIYLIYRNKILLSSFLF